MAGGLCTCSRCERSCGPAESGSAYSAVSIFYVKGLVAQPGCAAAACQLPGAARQSCADVAHILLQQLGAHPIALDGRRGRAASAVHPGRQFVCTLAALASFFEGAPSKQAASAGCSYLLHVLHSQSEM